MIIQIGCLVLAYLLGSLSSAIIIAKLMHLPDPRLAGSKNAGATNMHRLYSKKHGKRPAILTLLLDALKGVIAVGIAQLLGLDLFWQMFCGVSVIFGHIYPIFFGFKGGKGVATFLGVLLVFYYPSFLVFVVCWLIIAKVFKVSALSALISCLIHLAVFIFIFDFDNSINWTLAFLSAILFYTHRQNIASMLSKK